MRVPRLQEPDRRWVSMGGAIGLALTLGIGYTFGLITEDLKERMNYTQSDINAVGSIGQFGQYLAVLGGLLYESRGPRVTLAVGGILSGTGFAIFTGLTLNGHEDEAPPLLFVSLSLFVALLGCAFLGVTAVAVTVRNFSADDYGKAMGLIKAAFGLGSSLWALIFDAFFDGRVGGYKKLITIVMPSIALLSMYPIRVVKPTSAYPDYSTVFRRWSAYIISMAVYVTTCMLIHLAFDPPVFADAMMAVGLLVMLAGLTLLPCLTTRKVFRMSRRAQLSVKASATQKKLNEIQIVSTRHLDLENIPAVIKDKAATPKESEAEGDLEKEPSALEKQGHDAAHEKGPTEGDEASFPSKEATPSPRKRKADTEERQRPEGIVRRDEPSRMDDAEKPTPLSPSFADSDRAAQPLKNCEDYAEVVLGTGEASNPQSRRPPGRPRSNSNESDCSVVSATSQSTLVGANLPELTAEGSDDSDTEEDDEVNLELYELFRTVEFYLLFFAFFACSGSGLLILNNIAQIDYAFKRSTKPGALIQLFGVCNFFGRLCSGYLSDVYRKQFNRLGFFSVSAVIMAVALFILSAGQSWTLAPCIAFCGAAFGCTFTMVPALTAELFGPVHFAANYGAMDFAPAMGGLVLSTLVTGLFYHDKSIGSRVEDCYGPQCFRGAFYFGSFFCVLAAAACLIVDARLRIKAPRRSGQSRAVDV